MRRSLRVFQTKGEAEAADAAYWLGRPVPERIAAVETLRAFRHGSSARMVRVLVVARQDGQRRPVALARLPKTKKRR